MTNESEFIAVVEKSNCIGIKTIRLSFGDFLDFTDEISATNLFSSFFRFYELDHQGGNLGPFDFFKKDFKFTLPSKNPS